MVYYYYYYLNWNSTPQTCAMEQKYLHLRLHFEKRIAVFKTEHTAVTGQLTTPSMVRRIKPLTWITLFFAYINDILRNTESTIRFFADDCIIYRKIKNNNDMETLQRDRNRLGEWAVENPVIQ
jgi:hypothetical protein